MAGKKSVIETGPDRLVRLIADRKKISVKDAAKDLGVSVATLDEWAEFLEEAGLVTLQTKLGTTYISERQISEKEIASRIKDAHEEKESFSRRIESSINSLERDSEEIKLIDSEFKKIRSLLESNFSGISKKLAKLEDLKRSESEIEDAEKSFEEKYGKTLGELQGKITQQQKEYDSVMKQVSAELEKIGSGSAKIDALKDSEKQLQSKAEEVSRLLDKVKTEIAKETSEISADADALEKSKKLAERLKSEIESESSSLKSVSKQLTDSRKSFEGMESMLKKDLELLSKGDLKNISAYKESKEMVAKFNTFLNKGAEIESLLKDAEKEEASLKEHFASLAKKVKSFSLITSSPKLRQELESLSKEIENVESEKQRLSGNLGKIRSFIRSLMS